MRCQDGGSQVENSRKYSDRFCRNLVGSKLEVGGGVEEASRVKVRAAWAKFNELSPILMADDPSNHVKGSIYR